MYYNNSKAPDIQNPEKVWDSNFKMVQHLNENNGLRKDSSINSNDCSPENGVLHTINGKINGADSFDGENDILIGPSSNELTGDYIQKITMSAWIKYDTIEDLGYIASIKKSSIQKNLISLCAGNLNDGSLGFVTRNYVNTEDVPLENNGGYNDGKWHHLVAVVDDLSRSLYIDGIKIDSDNEGMQVVRNNTAEFTIGGFYKNSEDDYFKGQIDEIQISNTARSDNFIKTSYENQNNPSTFLKMGSEIKNKDNIDWTVYKTDHNSDDGWNWTFDFPNGFGHYEFYSIGNELNKPIENRPESADARCLYKISIQETEDDENQDVTSNGVSGGSSVNVGNKEEQNDETPLNKKPYADPFATDQFYAYIGEEILFDASNSYDPDGDIISYKWGFGDGKEGNGITIMHSYVKTGEYSVNLTVTDQEGKKDISIFTILVLEPNIPLHKPIINGPNNTKTNIDTTFKISIPYSENHTYYVDWGDGSNKTNIELNPDKVLYSINHSYELAGNYTVVVSANDSENATTKTSFNVVVNYQGQKTNNIEEDNYLGLSFLIIIVIIIVIAFLVLIFLKKKKQGKISNH